MGEVQLVDKVNLPLGQQMKALVHTNTAGTLIIEPAREQTAKYGVSTTNGVHTVTPDTPFYLYIAKYSGRNVILLRNIVIACVLSGPETIFIPQDPSANAFQVFFDDVFEGADNAQPTEVDEVGYPIRESQILSGVHCLDLGTIHEVFHNDVRRMLSKHSTL